MSEYTQKEKLKDLMRELITESDSDIITAEDRYGAEYISGCIFFVDVRYIEKLCELAGIDLRNEA